MKIQLLIAGLLVLPGCAASSPAPSAAAAGTQRCIAISQIAGRYVLPPNAVAFELTGATLRNDLAGACPGLERLGPTAVIELSDHTGGQLCPGDRIRIYDPVEAKATGSRAYPTCVLGPFSPVFRR